MNPRRSHMAVRLLALLLFAWSCSVAQDRKEAEKLAPYYPTPPFRSGPDAAIRGTEEERKDVRSGERRRSNRHYGRGEIRSRRYRRGGWTTPYSTKVPKRFDGASWHPTLVSFTAISSGRITGPADLLTVYLLPASNDKVRPILEKQLKKGTRIVSHDFPFAGWTPEKVEQIEDDGEGRSHTLYLYRR